MNTTSQQFFEQMYRQNPDPWHFSSNPYELNRYQTIISALAHRRYARAFEPACSVGVLTEQLARLCDSVQAIDISSTAVAAAQTRCAALPNVRIACASLAESIPSRYDLLVFSEVGYYFTVPNLRSIITRCIMHLTPGGTLLASHWLGTSPDHILSGDLVHQTIDILPGLHLEHSRRLKDFRLDRWRKL
jgi:2-polyprenyl-3-methyl-5-hydroxy-6-metoxy-1,4-benzoquinol methylase